MVTSLVIKCFNVCYGFSEYKVKTFIYQATFNGPWFYKDDYKQKCHY